MMLTAILYILALLAEPHIPRNWIVPVSIGPRMRYEQGYTPDEYICNDEPMIWRDE